jgi:hypothetical protein
LPDQSPAPTPTLVSLLLCDQVIDDKLTNKKSAIGLFNMIVVQQMPAVINQMAVLASLTEITGKPQLELRLMRDADEHVVFSSKGFVNAPNPLAVVDLVFGMRGVRVESPGQYAFEVLHDGDILGRRRFQVVVAQRPPQQQQPPNDAPGGPA